MALTADFILCLIITFLRVFAKFVTTCVRLGWSIPDLPSFIAAKKILRRLLAFINCAWFLYSSGIKVK